MKYCNLMYEVICDVLNVLKNCLLPFKKKDKNTPLNTHALLEHIVKDTLYFYLFKKF